MFQPPLVIFQPPDLAAASAARPEDSDEASPARRRTRSARGSSAAGGSGGSGGGGQAETATAGSGDGAGPAGAGSGGAGSGGSGSGGSGPDGDGESGGPSSRRRRRGGRSHAKGRAEDGADNGAADGHGAAGSARDGEPDAAESGGGADGGASQDGESGEGAAGRRRRRRRRSGTAGEPDQAASDDPPNTVVHVRAPRTAEDASSDVRSVKGSTRLEAKRQRRREGRESGRRRPPIITESEFLARREAVERVMVVRQTGDRTQIAVLEDDVLVEHYVDKASSQSYVGNVYLGKVQNVLPSMEAAFVDIGKGRNAVLYAGEVNFDASGLEGESKRIESALKSGQSILVQATKDPIGHKGARLTSQVSLPGRYLVYVPGASMTGISRKLPDTERTRLKHILKQVMPEHAGVIVRTAAEGAAEEELARDVARLAAQWEAIERRAKSATAPELLYSEPDLTIRVVRDIFNEDFSKLVIASDGEWDIVDEYIRYVAPHLADRLERWQDDDGDVFAHYRIDEQIGKALERKVWLPSGGSLVIDTTEAMTVIDVNTGKFTGQGGNLEQTVTRNNLEAAEEIVRQLRVRDVGGIIVIDFIDMVLESNRDLVLRRLLECLARDRTKHQVAEVTSLGLVQMTRKRVGSGLLEAFSVSCEHCNGRGVLVSLEPVDHAHAPSGRDERGREDRGGKRSRGGDGRGSDARGGDARGGDVRGGDARGGEARGDEARGGDGRDGDARGGEARGGGEDTGPAETASPRKRSRSGSAKAKSDQAKSDQAKGDQAEGDQAEGDQAPHDQRQGDRTQGGQRHGDGPQGDRAQGDQGQPEHAQGGLGDGGPGDGTGPDGRGPGGGTGTAEQAGPDSRRDGSLAGGSANGNQAEQPASGGRRRRPAARREQAPPAPEYTVDRSADTSGPGTGGGSAGRGTGSDDGAAGTAAARAEAGAGPGEGDGRPGDDGQAKVEEHAAVAVRSV